MSFSLLGHWTVEDCNSVQHDWCATSKGPAGSVAVFHIRNTETCIIKVEILGEGRCDFSFTPDAAFLPREKYLAQVYEALQQALTCQAIHQNEWNKQQGIKPQ